MSNATLSNQADSYAKVIAKQIANNFIDLERSIIFCTELTELKEEYKKAKEQSTFDKFLFNKDVDEYLSNVKKAEEKTEVTLCDGYSTIEPLTVGLFGEWGAGKTHHLKLIKQNILYPPKDINFPKTTVPIFFNAWRFEKEEHIVLPLFETLLDTLERYERSKIAIFKNLSKTAIYHIKNIVKSLHYGISLKKGYNTLKGAITGDLPELAELKSIIDTDKIQKKAKEKTDKEIVGSQEIGELLSPEKLQSIYLNIPSWIEKITIFEEINFVFLIDDLDRCLPENTLKMLESIKLFLDVPSCAFVLAIDDDVVERGVIHHYRDYLSIYHNKDTQSVQETMLSDLPITGHEYLEKIVQLPIRLPVVDANNVKEFLKANSKKWITLVNKDKEQNQEPPSKALLEFFSKTIPPKPRKIKRVAKLFESKIELLNAMGLKGKCSHELLAKITLLELFAPKILRFIQSSDYAETYRAIYDFQYINEYEKNKKNTLFDTKEIIDFIDKNKDYSQKRKDRYKKLIDIISKHHNSRVVFDLGNIFNKTEAYEELKVAIEYNEEKTVIEQTAKEPKKAKTTTDNTVSLSKELLKELFLEDSPETWGATLRRNEKILNLAEVKELIALAKVKRDSKFNNLPFIANPEWVGEVAKFIELDSYKLLLMASHNARFKNFDNNNPKKQIDMFQLTFAEYDIYCDIANKAKPKDEGWGRGRKPIIYVSWDDAIKYIEWLNTFFKDSKVKYALPNEKEWEIACNNGKELVDGRPYWHFGDDESKLKEYAWYRENSNEKTHRVGEKKPNSLEFYDMHGNVWEWSADRYGTDGGSKILRGGSWNVDAIYTRSAYRVIFNPASRVSSVGFRLLRTLP